MPSNWLSCGNSQNTQTDTTQNTETTTQTAPQGEAAQNAQGGGDWTGMLIMVAIMVVFVLVMVIPQKRKEKKQREMLNSMKAGDEIRTIGGIYGRIVRVKNDLVTIETGPNKDQLIFAKGAVEFVRDPEAEAKLKELDKDDDEKKPEKKSFFKKKNK